MSTYRILVTGSRDWTDRHTVATALHDAVLSHDGPAVIVHGACPTGADSLAADWVYGALGIGWDVAHEPHPADWKTYGKGAGLRRNAEMVALGADLCLAFIGPCTKRGCTWPGQHGSHGARHCADLAEQAGIETRRFTA